MALTLRYVGARPYTEFLVDGALFGFSRGMERTDVPEEWIRRMILPAIENGAEGWQVDGANTNEQIIELLSEDEVEEEVVVVEEPVVEETADPDDVLLEAGFDASLTRAQMMSWCAERGIAIVNTDTKDILSQKARDYVTGESE